jgi:branched-chain amino acid transport system ATP-binding protein
MDAILAVHALSKRYGGLLAVQRLDFALARGEIVGLIGPNGAGKTTVINLISGTTRPSGGSVIFEGRSIADVPAFRRARLGIGRTFQLMKPFPGLSVCDNVAVGALFGAGSDRRGLRAARDEAHRWLDFVGLGARAEELAVSLGGPDRKRLEFAKALAMQPRLLLLDEVMAGLNHVEIDAVIELIKKMRDSGVSILVIEHVMKAIKVLSDRLIVLHHGVKIAEGQPDAVLSDPQVVSAYLGNRRL